MTNEFSKEDKLYYIKQSMYVIISALNNWISVTLQSVISVQCRRIY